MAIDIYEIVFEGFLRLEECGGNQTWGCFNNEIQHDFVFALFIPHIVLVAFFFIAFRGLGNKGIESLLAVGGYMFMIEMGWYPVFSTLTLVWMTLAIGLSFYFFIMGKIIHPAKTGAYYEGGKGIAKKIKGLQRKGMTMDEIINELEGDVSQVDNPVARLMLVEKIKKLKHQNRHD